MLPMSLWRSPHYSNHFFTWPLSVLPLGLVISTRFAGASGHHGSYLSRPVLTAPLVIIATKSVFILFLAASHSTPSIGDIPCAFPPHDPVAVSSRHPVNCTSLTSSNEQVLYSDLRWPRVSLPTSTGSFPNCFPPSTVTSIHSQQPPSSLLFFSLQHHHLLNCHLVHQLRHHHYHQNTQQTYIV